MPSALRESSVHVQRRELLKYPDFRLLLTSQFASQVADALTTFTIAELLFFTFADGPSLRAMGIGLLMAAIPLLVVGPIAGNLVDRYRRNFIMWAGHVLRAIITLLLIPMVIWHQEWLGYVVFGSLLALSRVLYTARATSLPKLVRRHELVAAGSSSLIAGVVAGAVGAGIGSFISSPFPIVAVCLATLGHLVATRGYARIVTDLGGAEMQQNVSFLSVRAEMISAKTRYAILSTMSHRFLLGIAFAGIAVYLDKTMDLNTTGYVTVLGAAAIGSFCGSVASEWISEHLTKRSITAASFFIAAAAMTTAASLAIPLVGLGAVTVTAFGFQTLRIRADATIQANSRPESVGHIFAAYDILYNAFFICGGAAGMVFALRYELPNILGSVAVLYGVGALTFSIIAQGKGQGSNDAIESSVAAHRIESLIGTTHPLTPKTERDISSTITTNAFTEANRSSWVPMDNDEASHQEVKDSPAPVRIDVSVPVTTRD